MKDKEVINKKGVYYITTKNPSKKTIEEILESKKEKVAFSWKPLIKKVLREKAHIDTNKIFDIKIAAWLLNPDNKSLDIENISKKICGKKTGNLELIHKELRSKIKINNLENIFKDIEIPLIEVLASMETRGVKINKNKLKNIKISTEKSLEKLEKNIYKKANKKFNINSPKQLGEVLFKDLKISSKKKTSTGQYSTSEEVLIEIKNSHPIIKDILEYRNLFKKLSGFILPLDKLSKKKNRIYTTFLQTGTGTGRLSSENPNMQNIPINKGGSKDNIRNIFVATKGYKLVSFDYSQLEIRLMAHASNDKTLKEMIKSGKDIHALTASRIFNKHEKNIKKEERNIAKTLNFGIIYGMGKVSFSKQSGLSVKKSEKLIEKYFNDFPDIKRWQDKVLKESKEKGFIKNDNGRIRKIKKGWAMERAAINMPIQSLGADIIKKAMIEAYKKIKLQGWQQKNKTHIILSIHDELILEIKKDMLELIIPEIKNILESIYKNKLKVPLIVNVKHGENWGNLKKYDI